MPAPAFMAITGTDQGLITAGALTQKSVGIDWAPEHRNKILVQAITHSIVIPTNGGKGSRMHKPLTITKEIDRSSPLLNTAMCYSELLRECRLELYRTDTNGAHEHFYTVELDDAMIVGIDLVMPHRQDPADACYTQFERVHFAYRCISWKHHTGETMGMDVWQSADR